MTGLSNSYRSNIFHYVAPAVLTNVSSFLFSVVDGLFVGNGVGTDALAAVNICVPFVPISIALNMMEASAELQSELCGLTAEIRKARTRFFYIRFCFRFCLALCSLLRGRFSLLSLRRFLEQAKLFTIWLSSIFSGGRFL